MTGRFEPPIYFLYLAVCQYIALMLLWSNDIQTTWIDRLLVAQVIIATGVTVVAVAARTRRWSRRGLGWWGFCLAGFLLAIISQLGEFHVISRPAPQWIVNIYRSPLSLSLWFILYGYYRWNQGKAWDDEVQP